MAREESPSHSQLAALVQNLGSSATAAGQLRDFVTQQCEAVGGEKAGTALLSEMLSRSKSDSGAQPTIERRKEALLCGLVEVLRSALPHMMHEAIAKQIEELVKVCTHHFRRTVIRLKGTSSFDARHVDAARVLAKELGQLRKMGWRALAQSVDVKRARELVRDVERAHDGRRGKRQRSDDDHSSKPGLGSPADVPLLPPVSMTPPLPPRPAASPKSPSAHGSPAMHKAPSPAVHAAAPSNATRYDVCRFVRDTCDALKLGREAVAVASYYLHTFLLYAALEPSDDAPCTESRAIRAAVAVLDRRVAMHAFNLAQNQSVDTPAVRKDLAVLARSAAKPGTLRLRDYQIAALPIAALREASDEYLRALPSDVLAAIGLAAVHLAAKARDAPQRLTAVLDAARHSSMKRGWPLALPWRDPILSFENKILRCLCFDLRVDDAKPVLEALCPIKEAKDAAMAIAGPPAVGRDRLAISVALRDAALDVLATPAFQATGLCAEHEPRVLVAAAVWCAAKNREDLNLKDKDWKVAAVEACCAAEHGNPPPMVPDTPFISTPEHKACKAKLGGIVAEVEKAHMELRARFGTDATAARIATLDPAAIVAARHGAARRAACAALARLAKASAHEQSRYISRRAQDHLKPAAPAAQAAASQEGDGGAGTDSSPLKRQKLEDGTPPSQPTEPTPEADCRKPGDDVKTLLLRPVASRRRKDDECGVAVYYSDAPVLKKAAAKLSEQTLDLLVFPRRPGDAALCDAVPALAAATDGDDTGGTFEVDTAIIRCGAEPDPHPEDDGAALASLGADVPRHFYPVLHVVWPRSDVESKLKLDDATVEDAHERTAALAADLVEVGKSRPRKTGKAPSPITQQSSRNGTGSRGASDDIRHSRSSRGASDDNRHSRSSRLSPGRPAHSPSPARRGGRPTLPRADEMHRQSGRNVSQPPPPSYNKSERLPVGKPRQRSPSPDRMRYEHAIERHEAYKRARVDNPRAARVENPPLRRSPSWSKRPGDPKRKRSPSPQRGGPFVGHYGPPRGRDSPRPPRDGRDHYYNGSNGNHNGRPRAAKYGRSPSPPRRDDHRSRMDGRAAHYGSSPPRRRDDRPFRRDPARPSR